MTSTLVSPNVPVRVGTYSSQAIPCDMYFSHSFMPWYSLARHVSQLKTPWLKKCVSAGVLLSKVSFHAIRTYWYVHEPTAVHAGKKKRLLISGYLV